MPELPEVETIAALLCGGAGAETPSIIGCRVKDARVLWPRTLANLEPAVFRRVIRGQEVLTVGRRGKFLAITLSRGTLLLHLRMSGDVHIDPAGQSREPAKHDRLVVEFICGQRLVFNDTRKFGRAWLVDDPSEVVGELGPEPLDESLTEHVFFGMLKNRKRQLKPLLMDQRFLAGMGNIYTDEALHAACLHPLQTANRLTETQAADLLAAMRSVLREGIRRNGASIDWVYRGGSFQNYFRVYGRAGQPCLTCGIPIERLLVGQRGTHICPRCQRM
jgi:formamidopyrimidine-DNA glycosylase